MSREHLKLKINKEFDITLAKNRKNGRIGKAESESGSANRLAGHSKYQNPIASEYSTSTHS